MSGQGSLANVSFQGVCSEGLKGGRGAKWSLHGSQTVNRWVWENNLC